MGSHFLSVVYGLGAAFSYGTGDFVGGIATKKTSVFPVIIVSQLTGGLLLFVAALMLAQPFPGRFDILMGAASGVCGTSGLACLYKGLSEGRMGIVAPIAAVISTVFPVVVGMLIQGIPAVLQIAGFILAVISVWLLSGGGSQVGATGQELKLSIGAGLGFGLFFICISQISLEYILWPLVSARVTSIILFASFIWLNKKQLFPEKKDLFPIIIAGCCDALGNVFFVLAAKTGRLDISVVVTSIYPAITVLFAWIMLKERLSRAQWTGFWMVIAALLMIALE